LRRLRTSGAARIGTARRHEAVADHDPVGAGLAAHHPDAPQHPGQPKRQQSSTEARGPQASAPGSRSGSTCDLDDSIADAVRPMIEESMANMGRLLDEDY
jgi:hypothetical protein